jgi:NitT/TauT family transport system ATP-binding protein
MKGAKVKVDKVAKTYKAGGGSITAVKDCSFEVSEGEFLSPTEGQIYFDGQLCNGIIGRERAMVFQEPTLFPWLRVKDNIAFGLKFRGCREEESTQRVKKYVTTMGLIGFEDRLPHELSGGMRQRAMLARTLVNEPDVLLMDEPFASVDAYTREILQLDLLRVWGEELLSTERKTVIFVTHSIEEAILLGDRILVCTHRPACPLSEVNPELGRPRCREMIATPYFVGLKEELSVIMREQVLKSREIELVEGV